MTTKSFNLFFYISLAVLAIIYCIGMQLDLMEIDSATDGLISKGMFQSGNYLELYLRGGDYLDKPPMVFWAACLSFKLFGIHDWAYRLPSVLCLALGIYSVYRYAKLFYSEQVAKMAALIMASCMATYVMTTDVRTDTMLTGWVMFSFWQLAEFNRSLKFKNILLGTVGIGFAMLTKGPIGLIIPAVAFSVDFAYKRQWKNFFRWQYLIALLVIAVMLVPMSYGLYEQFDLHPEKRIYGRIGTSGLRFYYWTQSFGRITGESSWSNNPDKFFLFHSFLWSFAPWSILFIPALFTEIKNKVSRQWSVVSGQSSLTTDNCSLATNEEAITVGGFVLILIFLALSKYQLPHYTFAIHPLAAILTAKYLDSGRWSVVSGQSEKPLTFNFKNFINFQLFYGLHLFLLLVIFAVLFLVVLMIFPAPVFFPILIGLSFCCCIYVLFFNSTFNIQHSTFVVTLVPFVLLILILNTVFYPAVLNYQSGSHLAKDLVKEVPENSELFMYKDYASLSLLFYTAMPIVEYADEQKLKANMIQGKTFVFADTADVKAIQHINPEFSVVRIYYDYPASLLSWKFLNPATRSFALTEKALMRY